MNVALVGGEGAGAQALRLLLRLGHPIVALAAAEDPPELPGLARAAQGAQLRTLSAAQLARGELTDTFAGAQIDVGLNVHSLAKLPAEVLRTARIGWFNLHPGLLPGFGGVMSASWALVEGATEHGATLHWMDAGLDTGAIAFQTRFPIGETDTGGTLSLRALRDGLTLIERLLATAAAGEAVPRQSQDRAALRRFGWRPPHAGQVPFDQPAARIARLVRACDYLPLRSPWPAPRVRAGDQELGLARVTVTQEPCTEPPGTVGAVSDDGVRVATIDCWLAVERVVVAGGSDHPPRYEPAAQWLRSGMRLEAPAA